MDDPKWRISPSKIEAIRRFFDYPNPPTKRQPPGGGRIEWEFPPWKHVGDPELVEAIISERPDSEQMELGRLVHKAIEDSAGARVGPDGCFQRVYGAVDVRVPETRFGQFGSTGARPPNCLLREAYVEKTMPTAVGDIRFRGRIDMGWPGVVVDYKTSTRAADWKNHLEAWAWRCYCLILDVDHAIIRHYQYSKWDERGKRWNKRYSVGKMVVRCAEPQDLDLFIGQTKPDAMADLGRALVAQAERLDCAGALREDRYELLKKLAGVGRDANEMPPNSTALGEDTVRACRCAIEGLRRNEYDPNLLVSTIRALRAWRDKCSCNQTASEGGGVNRTADWYTKAAAHAAWALYDMEELR